MNAPIPAGSPTLPQPDFPGINAAAAGPGTGIDPNFRPSESQQYDLTIQRQVNNRMSIEFGYIGRHLTHEYQSVQINAVPYMMTLGGQRFDKAYGQMVMQYCGGNAGLAGGGCAGNLGAVTAQPFFETALAGTGYSTGSGWGGAIVSRIPVAHGPVNYCCPDLERAIRERISISANRLRQ